VLAGGVEVLTETMAGGLAEPGFELSEGACLFVLERAEDADRRGVNAMALSRGRPAIDPAIGATSPSAGAEPIVSTAGFGIPGAVCIELAVGFCIGAAAAAALAAGIGAALGAAVPVAPQIGSSAEVRRPGGASMPLAGPVCVRVLARHAEQPERSFEAAVSPHPAVEP
jgi:hypothetical protein